MAVKAPFVRSPYNYDVEKASNEATIPADQQGESLTIQSMTEDADLNVLMRRYGITGKFPENPRVPQYGDFTEVRDFRSALEAVNAGWEAFYTYPAEFRQRFANDPQRFLEWSSDPASRPEMQKLGMLASLEAPQAAIVTPPATQISPPSTAAPSASNAATGVAK